MHEATVTIVENSKPANPKAPNVLRVDTGSGQLKMKAWPDLNPSAWNLGDTLDVSYLSEEKEYMGKAYTEHTIKTAKHHAGAPGGTFAKDLSVGAARAADVGPHVAMWEKEVFRALIAAEAGNLIVKGIEARRVAREILKTDLDAKLPAEPEFNDSLEDSF